MIKNDHESVVSPGRQFRPSNFEMVVAGAQVERSVQVVIDKGDGDVL